MNDCKFFYGKTVPLVILVIFIFMSAAQADIVGLWRFEEVDGNDVLDSSTYGNDGGLWASLAHQGKVGGVATDNTVPRRITGKYGKGLEFGTMPDGSYPDADNQNWNYVYVSHSPELANLGTVWTIAVWVKQYVNDPSLLTPLGGLGYQRVVSCPHYELELGVPTDMHDYFWPYYEGGTTYFDVQIGATQATGSWYHLAYVYDGTDLIKYINGTEQTRVNIPNQTLPATFDPGEYLRFGAQSLPIKDYFIGALDDVAIFNEALDTTQIAEIRDGNFAGPWTTATAEEQGAITYLYDPTFIIRYNNGQVILAPGEKSNGQTSFNWQMEGIVDNNTYYGLANAALWDGDISTIEYAGYVTVGDRMVQKSSWKPITKDIKYDFTARVGAENGVGNIVGVKFYAVNPADANDKTLLADLNQTIAANETWYNLHTTYTAVAGVDMNNFKAECYIDQGTGNPRGTAFGYYDYVRIDVNDITTCEALVTYNYGGNPGLPYDIDLDCEVGLGDVNEIASDWINGNNPEPSQVSGNLLVNGDFYEDLSLVPNNGDFDGNAPTGWQYSPATGGDTALAGIWNRDRNGLAQIPGYYQAAGGSVAAYIDPNTELLQTITSETIQNGQTYYLSTMVGCAEGSYLSILQAHLEAVDNPVSPTTITEVAEVNFVVPELLVWRAINAEFTADSSTAGKYLRLRYNLDANTIPGAYGGYGMIGSASVTKTKPETWYRDNLLTNGDFEDFSSLPKGTNNDDGWFDLFNYVEHYTLDSIPGWDANGVDPYYFGLQCMFFAPSPQPAQGRIACWFNDAGFSAIDKIGQKVTSETIVNGQTYYLDYIGSLNASAYAGGGLGAWPQDDPNLVVDVYWLKAGVNKPVGVEGTDYGLITSLKAPIVGPLIGGGSYNVPWGFWVSPETSFTAGASLAGKSFYVEAYCDNPATPYPTFEEIFLSKQPRIEVTGYTCYEQVNKFGALNTDLNNDCNINLEDYALLASQWLACNNPQGCN